MYRRRRREPRQYRRRRENYNDPFRSISSTLRRPGTQVAILAVIALIVYLLLQAGNSSQRNSSSSLPHEISIGEAFTKYQNGAFLLDVRTAQEWNEVHIPNTILIPLDQLASRVNEVPRDREVVVLCRSGDCARQGSDILYNSGFTQVASMTGSLNDWRGSGYPTQP